MVDFNQALTVAEAIQRGRMIDDEGGVHWIEEPIRADDFAGCARSDSEVTTPIQIGENFMGPEQMAQALAAGACDYVMPDAQRIGGVTGWMRAAALAQGAGMEMSSHLFPEVSCHLLAATPTCHWLEYVDWADAGARGAACASKDGHVDGPRCAGHRHEVGRESRQAVRRFDVHSALPALAAGAAEDPRAAAHKRLLQPRGKRARAIRQRAAIDYYGSRITYARAQARGRRARRLPAAALRRGARRPRAALRAEQPAVHHRLLRDPARRRGGGAGQSDEPHRGAAPLRRGFGRARRDRRPGRAARDRADLRPERMCCRSCYSDYLDAADRPAGAGVRARAAVVRRRGRTRSLAPSSRPARITPARTTWR